jgi:hypothetical protein
MTQWTASVRECQDIPGNGNGKGDVADNFNRYKELRATESPEDAARGTFTGKMAGEYGFNNVRVVTESIDKVVLEFTT